MTKSRRGFLISSVVLVLSLAVAPALADRDKGWKRRAGPGMSLDHAVEQIRRETGGRVLSAETERDDGRQVHRIRILTDDGRVRRIRIDGESGQRIRRRR